MKNSIGLGDDYTTGCVVKKYKTIAVDLSKQQALGADPKVMQPVNFIGNIAWERNANTSMVFITEDAKERYLDFSLWEHCEFLLF